MPSIDDLLDAECTRWRADTDARFETSTFTIEPVQRHPVRPRAVWVGSALAAAAAAAIALVTLDGSSGDKGPALAGPTPERSVPSVPGPHTSAPNGGVVGAGSCAGPILSFRDPLGHKHLRVVATLPHPVRRGRTVRLFGVFFLATCHDTGQGGPERPTPSVRLVLRDASGQLLDLAVVHPHGESGKFTQRIRIPSAAAPGMALIGFGRSYGHARLTIAAH